MGLRILLASNDERYVKKLADVMSQTPLDTGDTLEISLFTDASKLEAQFEASGNAKLPKYDAAIVDESMAPTVSKGVPLTLIFAEEASRDSTTHPAFPNANYVFKFQRVTDIVKKMLLALAKYRKDMGIGDGVVCAFFSPQGGSGTSSMAAAFAIAAARMGVKPLFVSFEHFNGTELFFSSLDDANQGLYDVFYVIAGQGSAATAIDVAKAKDANGVTFLNKFPMWREVSQLDNLAVETFINAAKAAHETDIVVLDLGGGFSPLTEKTFELCDEIFIVSCQDELSKLKLSMFLDKETYFIQEYLGKCNLIVNKAQSQQAQDYADGLKSTAYVPPTQGATVAEIAANAEGYLRGLIKPSWKRSETKI